MEQNLDIICQTACRRLASRWLNLRVSNESPVSSSVVTECSVYENLNVLLFSVPVFEHSSAMLRTSCVVSVPSTRHVGFASANETT